ncbi:MAG: choice-of-anchor B family protein [Patiriisocius sp.]|uniref:choice-of-anchor B family protein n=1 Tax=Patiriisocius sp. TaxID=2822396 RepID=UPI003EF5A6F2
MKKLLFYVLLATTSSAFAQSQLTLQKHFSVTSMGAIEAQDSWGWTDTDGDGDEYAIVGLDNGTAFVRINNGTNAEYLGRMPSFTGSGYWRDVKIYNNHAYIVSDGNGSHGIQIFDLTRLRNVTGASPQNFNKNGDGHYGGITNCHNIIINEDTGFLYILGANVNGGAPRILSLANPKVPTLVANMNSGYSYCHDAQVVLYDGPDPNYQGREIMIGSFSGDNNVKILDVTNKSNITQISSINYSNRHYTHQGWFTEDKRFFLVGDEIDEEMIGGNTRTFVFDLSDLQNPLLHYTYFGTTTATDHNGYVRGNRFYLANYKAGARVIKLDGLYENPPSMTEVNFYDTMSGANSAGTEGVWNVYPYLDSGNLIVTGFGRLSSNTDGGFFIVKDPNYDNESPIAIAQDLMVTLANAGTVTINAIDIDNNSTDNKGITSYKINGQDSITFSCDDVGTPQVVTLTVKDDYGFTDTATATINVEPNETMWLGSLWDDGNPGPGSYARIAEDYNTSIDNNIDACTCSVNIGKTLDVAAEGYINIQKDITVNGILNVAHTANVVQKDSDAVVIKGANGTIDVALTTPALNARDFLLLGSPMVANSDAVFNNPYQLLKHTTENFSPFPGIVGVNFLNDNTNGFDWSNHTGNLNPGEGYYLRPSLTNDGTYNYNFEEGTLNSGDITYMAFFGDDKEDSPNILANPYASAIDASAFIDANDGIISEVYFWEHNITPNNGVPGPLNENFSMEDISTFNGLMGIQAASGGTVPNGVISTGQGFGIKANAGGPVTFTNAMRLTSGNTTLRNQENRDLIWLTVTENLYDLGSTAGLGFIESASEQMDIGYDTQRLGTVMSLYSHLQDGTEQLSIQGLGTFNREMSIPFGFSTLIEQTENLLYKISISNLQGDNLEGVTVLLTDNELGITTNLSITAYSFLAGAGTHNNRFTVHFENGTFGVTDADINNIKVFPNPTTGIVTILSPDTNINNIEIYDLRGRRIVDVLMVSDNEYRLDLAKLETSIYYATIKTESGTVTKKIIKN